MDNVNPSPPGTREFAKALFLTLYLSQKDGTYLSDLHALAFRNAVAIDKQWATDFLNREKDRIRSIQGGPTEKPRWVVALTAKGVNYVEEELASDPQWGLLRSSVQFPDAGDLQSADHGAASDTTSEDEPGENLGRGATPIESRTWTGRRSLPPERRANFIEAVRAAERRLDTIEAANSEKAEARAYILAMLALAETPDPPDDLLWELVNRANQLAGIAGLFIAVIALFAAS